MDSSEAVELSKVTTQVIDGNFTAEAIWAKDGKDFLIDSFENGRCSHVLL